jgi:cytochrome P450
MNIKYTRKPIPELKARGLLGYFPEFRDNPLQFLGTLNRECGDIAKFRMGPMYFYYVNHPDYIKQILITNRKNYHRDRKFLVEGTPILGRGLLTTDAEEWERLRRIAQPVFHANQMAKYASMISEVATTSLKRWEVSANKGQPLNIADEILRLTLDVVAPTLFGINVTDECQSFINSVNIIQTEGAKRLVTPVTLPLWIPTRSNIKANIALRNIDSTVFGMIAKYRQQHQNDQHNLMNALIQARDEETGDSLTDREIRDQVVTLLTAGYETTASILAWLFLLLSQHPEVEQKLRHEIDITLENQCPTYENISSMKYLGMVIQESLRLYPPIWIFARTPIQSDDLGDYKIPANTVVYIIPLMVQRHPKFWQSPEDFKPERFDVTEPTHPQLAYIPFGTGARSCIGRNFAIMMMQFIIIKVLQTYRFYLVPNQDIKPQFDITLHSHHGIYMKLEKI